MNPHWKRFAFKITQFLINAGCFMSLWPRHADTPSVKTVWNAAWTTHLTVPSVRRAWNRWGFSHWPKLDQMTSFAEYKCFSVLRFLIRNILLSPVSSMQKVHGDNPLGCADQAVFDSGLCGEDKNPRGWDERALRVSLRDDRAHEESKDSRIWTNMSPFPQPDKECAYLCVHHGLPHRALSSSCLRATLPPHDSPVHGNRHPAVRHVY